MSIDLVKQGRPYVGVVTSYSQSASKQGPHCTDCSGFFWRVVGKPKKQGKQWWGTARMCDDATGKQLQFKRVFMPFAGCVLLFPPHENKHGEPVSGHVAICVDPATMTILDCSGSRDGVHEHHDDKAHFFTRPDAIFCQYIGG